MSAPVFLADSSQLSADTVELSGTEGRHAATVRRIRAGERIDLSDGAGLVAECVVTGVARGRLSLAVLSRRTEPRPQPLVVAVQAIPKGSRGELAVEMMTEVGVDVIVPWAAQRCVPRWEKDRAGRAVARWCDTARAAAKQARRAWVPAVRPPETTGGVAGIVRAAACAVVLSPDAQVRLADVAVPRSGEVVVIAGPEGGLTDDEAGLLTAAGAIPARLGPSVLRTSSAAAVAAAILLSRSARW